MGDYMRRRRSGGDRYHVLFGVERSYDLGGLRASNSIHEIDRLDGCFGFVLLIRFFRHSQLLSPADPLTFIRRISTAPWYYSFFRVPSFFSSSGACNCGDDTRPVRRTTWMAILHTCHTLCEFQNENDEYRRQYCKWGDKEARTPLRSAAHRSDPKVFFSSFFLGMARRRSRTSTSDPFRKRPLHD
jgi:hypothetical protein